MTKLYELLGTKDRKLQEQRVEQLLGMVRASVIDLVIRYDARVGSVQMNVIGVEQAPVRLFYEILDKAKESLHEIELETVKQQLGQAVPPAVEQADAPADPGYNCSVCGKPATGVTKDLVPVCDDCTQPA